MHVYGDLDGSNDTIDRSHSDTNNNSHNGSNENNDSKLLR